MLRAAYVDMDGTLLGRGASLFHDADGAFTMLGARALEACARADVEVVPYSGRRQSTLLHNAVLLGLRSYIFEAGCGMVLDGEVMSLVEELDDAGAHALLLARYPGRLEMYDPWNRGRESSRLYLGRDVDVAEADELLIEEGFGALAAGRQRVDARGGRRWAGVSPGARGRPRRRVRSRRTCRRAGSWRRRSSRSGTRWRTSARPRSSARSGSWRTRRLRCTPRRAGVANVRVAEGMNGAGVYEAVITELAERR